MATVKSQAKDATFDQESSPSSAQTSQPIEVKYVSTEEAYAQWAAVYDTDGNFLQATDDMELEEKLPRLLAMAGVETRGTSSSTTPPGPGKKVVLDLGCGTGRNTLKLRRLTDPKTTIVIGVDNSAEMLDIAGQKLRATAHGDDASPVLIQFSLFDIREPARCFSKQGAEQLTTSYGEPAFAHRPDIPRSDVMISSLVIEHIECDQFFAVASHLLRPNGLFLLTNMHSEMGKISQAGFVSDEGVKVRPQSFAHSLEEVCRAGKLHGFDVIEVFEKEVAESDVLRLGFRSRKWVGVKCWYGVIFRKLDAR